MASLHSFICIGTLSGGLDAPQQTKAMNSGPQTISQHMNLRTFVALTLSLELAFFSS